jgi:leucyl-tRNA synthetase
MEYNFRAIEKKWQNIWAEEKIFKTQKKSDKPKFYVLDMFPYPSGAGLHVGHPLGYIASDIYARFKRLNGYNVLHPMGYDSFGLPAEQYAIQTGQHPAITTKTNIEGGKDKQGNAIDGYEKQLKKIGLSYDWDSEIRTSQADYYKWTQWIFIQFFNHYYDLSLDKALPISTLTETFEKEGNASVNATCDEGTPTFNSTEWNTYSEKEKAAILLKYRLTFLAEAEVNWCPALGTVLANDEVINGLSERGGHPVERKKMTQWMMRITAYAERLLIGLDSLQWSDAIKESQRHWIGKSKGASVTFYTLQSNKKIDVFTTRPDTIFGVSFLTLAPEHPLVKEITTADKKESVEKYVQKTSKRTERERMADVDKVSGEFTGAYALHPFTGESIPVWISDYVLASYGTGAVMAVPAGDERDFKFAQHFNLPITNIFNQDISENAFTRKDDGFTYCNSDFLNGLNFTQATTKIIQELETKAIGKGKINFRLRDAVFSRQRYWGEPVPIYFNNGIPMPIPVNCLPLELPEINEYLPTETGEPPLGRAKNWAWDTVENKVVSVDLINQTTIFPLELNTMPGWAGSSWYWMRYMDAKNPDAFVSKEALNYWENVDLYLGGSEHATGHLLYARFWNKFLKDLGIAPTEEPFKKLINQGMILGMSALVYRDLENNSFISKNLVKEKNVQPIHVDLSCINESNNALNIEKFRNWRDDFKEANFINENDGNFYVGREVEKMSKSKYNVVNPDAICKEFGADTLRLYEMFLGPIEQAKPWNTQGLSGVFGFLKKFWRLFIGENGLKNLLKSEPSKPELKILHETIKKVTESIESFSLNTAVSQFMIATNELTKLGCRNQSILEQLLVILSPYAPHISEELWQKLGKKETISFVSWPVFNPAYLIEDNKEYPVSFNGKTRFTIEFPMQMDKETIEKIILTDDRTIKYLEGRTPKKVIVIPGKIINIVG